MSSGLSDTLFLSGLMAYLFAALAGLACWRRPAAARIFSFAIALTGTLLELAASAMALTRNASTTMVLPWGMPFLLMSHAGTGLLLVAFLILASAAGSLDFASFHLLGSQLPAAQQSVVFLLFFLGFGVKAGIVPLHIWLPAAHPVAPSNISALMSGVIIKTGIYGLTRVLFDFLGAPPLWWGVTLLTVGTISAVLGVLYALMEHDLK